MRSVLRRQRCIARYKKLYGLVSVDEAFGGEAARPPASVASGGAPATEVFDLDEVWR